MAGALLRDLKASLRALAAGPGLSIAAVLTLAVGIGTSTALYSVIRGAILDPWPYTGFDRIVTIRGVFPKLDAQDRRTLSAAEFGELEARTDVFEAVLAGVARNVNLTGGSDGRPERVRGAAMTAGAFPMLGVPPLVGRVFSAEEAGTSGQTARVVVMGYGLWRRHFGSDRGVVGRTLRIAGEPWTVIGVMPPRFTWWSCDLYFPLAVDRTASDRSARDLYVQARLAAGLTPAAAERRLEAWERRVEREHGAANPEYAGWRISMRPLVDEVLRDLRQALWVLLAAVGFLLAVACPNVAGLLLARATDRRRELALRAALGASRGRLVRQLLAESVLLSLAAGAIGFGIARLALDAILSLIPFGYIAAEAVVSIDVRAALFATALSAVSGAGFGLVPALAATRGDLAASLAEAGRGSSAGRRGRRVRDALVAVQVGVAVVLLSGAGLVIGSLTRLLSAPAGFSSGGVLTLRVDLTGDRYTSRQTIVAFHDEVTRRLRRSSGVEEVASVTAPPLSGASASAFELEGRAGPQLSLVLDADAFVATPRYFAAIGAPVLSGRSLEERDTADAAPVAVVNAAMARRFWGAESPIGRRLRSTRPSEPWRTIVGVVGDLPAEDLARPARAAFFVPLAQTADPPRNLAVVVRAKRLAPEAVADLVRAQVAAVDPELPVYMVRTLDGIVKDSLGGKRLAAVLLGAFAAAALLLSGVGLAGSVAYSVARREREVGVRVALGARPGDIRRMFVSDALPVFAAGAAGGLAVSLAAAAALRSVLEWTSPLDPLLVAGIVLLLAAVEAAATLLPVRRATRLDPVAVLQNE